MHENTLHGLPGPVPTTDCGRRPGQSETGEPTRNIAVSGAAGSRAGGGGGWHKAWVSDYLPLAAPIGLSPLHILTLCGPERVLVVSTEPPDDLSCLTTPGVSCPGDGLLPVPLGWGGGADENTLETEQQSGKTTKLHGHTPCARGVRLLGFGCQLPPPPHTNRWPEAPLGGGQG